MNRIEPSARGDTVQALRMESAREHAATHVLHVTLTRWTGNEVEMELARALPESSRSRWHAQVQRDFTDWLAAGGFAQPQPQDAALADAHETCVA